MSPDDNVIPFPAAATSRAVQDTLAQLLAHGFDPFARRAPTLLPRRDEPATYRLRVALDDTDPAVWRRVDVPSDLSLDRMHHVVQAAMGWGDYHLHAFLVGPDDRDPDVAAFVTDLDVEEGEDAEDGIHERDVRLDEVLAEPGQRLFYEYDFGDGWEHTLTLEAVLPPGPAGCSAGERACPPEDCGGIPGYAEILAIAAGERVGERGYGVFESREHYENWMPDGWTPDGVDLSAADEAVAAVVAGGIPGVPTPDELNPVLAQLLDRCAGTPAHTRLQGLIAAALGNGAGGGASGAVPDRIVETAMAPVQAVLDVMGPGVTLSAAGYLPAAHVARLAERLGIDRDLVGDTNREHLMPRMVELRTAMQRLGLLHKTGRRQEPTTAAIRYQHDPAGLWRHVASRLPLGSAAQKSAGMLLLLGVAAGGTSPAFFPVAAEILASTGWRNGRVSHDQVLGALEPTWDALYALDGFSGGTSAMATRVGLELAVAAIRRR